jgi:RNA polymerase sigma-70 factor, ECF subfamily
MTQRSPNPVRTSPLTEAELIQRAQQGDSDAFGVLVEEHAGFVRRLTRAILRDADDSDDAAQDAFFAAWRARDRFDPGRPFRPWLAQIALNAARDLQRRRTIRQTEALPSEVAGGGSDPARDTELSLLRRRLDAALAELSERQRLAVVLFDVEGFAHREIAALLKIPEGTVRSEVFHARRKLRAILGTREEA